MFSGVDWEVSSLELVPLFKVQCQAFWTDISVLFLFVYAMTRRNGVDAVNACWPVVLHVADVKCLCRRVSRVAESAERVSLKQERRMGTTCDVQMLMSEYAARVRLPRARVADVGGRLDDRCDYVFTSANVDHSI